jgi:hypothetical protein
VFGAIDAAGTNFGFWAQQSAPELRSARDVLLHKVAAAELRVTRGCSGIGSYALHLNGKSVINQRIGVQRQGTDCCHSVKPLPVSGNIMRPILMLLSFYLISCSDNSLGNATRDTSQQAISQDKAATGQQNDTLKKPEPGTYLYVWAVDFEGKSKQKNPRFKENYLNVDTLIKGLNQLYPNIRLERVKISRDTLYTSIKDSEYLGERIGSYGAEAYIADAVINLTSVPNINYVNFDFEDGSHISHGTWGKDDYKEYKEK